MKRLLFFIFVCFQTLAVQAQPDSSSQVRYQPGFRFREGIYLNFNQLKTNHPIPFSRIDYPGTTGEMAFPEKLLQQKSLSFFDQNGVRSSVSTSSIWGYSLNGALFVQYNDEWQRIPVFGRISHFVGNAIVVNQMRADPFYRNPYYFDPMRNTSYSTKEMRQLLLDYDTGQILEYDRESLKIILMRDPALFDEFNLLSRRKQKQSLFLYIRKYNERNPVYFPK